MLKWAVPFAVLALVILGLVFSGVLGGDDPVSGKRSAAPAPAASSDALPSAEFDLAIAPSPASGAPSESPDALASGDTAAAPLAGGSGAIAGRIADPSGAPVEGAVLHLIPVEAAGRPMGMRFGGELPALDAAEGRALSDAEGRFRYEGLAEGRTFDLVVRAEGWVGQRRREIRPGPESVEIVLLAGESVTGIVIDPKGRPVAGAVVAAGPTVAEIGHGIVLHLGDDSRDDSAVMPLATTGPGGTFTLSGVPAGRFSVFASHERYSPSSSMNLMQGQEGITLELRANTAIEGRVVDETGAPVAGATVSSMAAVFAGDDGRGAPPAESDENGAFRLEGLAPGDVHLFARSEDRPMRSHPTPVPVAEGETVTGIEIVLARAAKVTGTIVDPDGRPLSGATVRLRDHRSEGRAGGMRSTVSGEDGTFVLPAIAPDPEELDPLLHAHVEHPAHADAESAPFQLRAGVDIELGTIALVEAVTVSGRIATPEGDPIEGAQVELVQGGESFPDGEFAIEMLAGAVGSTPMRIERRGGSGRAASDAEGNYRLRVREPGSYRVAASASGRQRTESAEIAVGDRSVAGIDIELPPALRIEGTVVDELGAPCEGVVVRANAERRSGQSEKTGPDGAFVVDGLSPGAHLLDLAGGGWALAGDPPQVDAGDAGVAIVALRPGRIAGRIVDSASGRPVDRFTVRSSPDWSRGGGVFEMGFELGGVEYHDPDGRFVLEGIRPGNHVITAKAPARVEQKVPVTVSSGATTEVTIPLELAGIVVGRVLDTAGNPVEGATVTWERIRKDGEPPEEQVVQDIAFAFAVSMDGGGGGAGIHIRGFGDGPARTDADGRFRLDGIADGEVRLRLRHDSFREKVEEPVRARKGEETDAGTLVLERGATVRGAVRHAGSQRLMWTSIRLTPAAGGQQRTAQAGAGGAYEVGGLDAGEYRVEVEYMLEPTGPPADHEFVQPKTHDAGTVRLATDELLPFDIAIPLE